MFRPLKIFLLCALVFQVSMMPISQAFAARHVHDDSHEHPGVSVSASPSSVAIEPQHTTKFNESDNLSDVSLFPALSHETQLSSQCGKKNGHKGSCGSCQCTSIIGAPAPLELLSVFVPAEYYGIQLSYPPYSVVIGPLLRPPTS